MRPDRIVIRTRSPKAKKQLETLYAPYVRQGNPILFMDERFAEFTKYAANGFLALKISFINEIANLCEKLGADVDQVRMGIGTDERIDKRFLLPGIGYGGSCLSKDTLGLIKTAEEHHYDFKTLKASRAVNECQGTLLISKINAHFNGQLAGKRIALWGLSFKLDTDDIREAPSLYMIDALLAQGVSLAVYDPKAMGPAKKVKERKGDDSLYYALDPYDALKTGRCFADCNGMGRLSRS